MNNQNMNLKKRLRRFLFLAIIKKKKKTKENNNLNIINLFFNNTNDVLENKIKKTKIHLFLMENCLKNIPNYQIT